jgi:hypothetical protein
MSARTPKTKNVVMESNPRKPRADASQEFTNLGTATVAVRLRAVATAGLGGALKWP